MKKIYSFFVALVACAMLFVACEERPQETGKDIANATQLVEAHDTYYSHEYVEGVSNDFWMSFTTEDIEIPADEISNVSSKETSRSDWYRFL